jgi:hypothetical protein
MRSSLNLSAVAVVVISLPLLFLAACYSRYSRLKHIPGPFLASFTDLLRFYHQNAGTFSAELLAKYGGPIVRVGPNTVLISDATAIPAIYTNHGEFEKVRNLDTCSVSVMLMSPRPIHMDQCAYLPPLVAQWEV